MFGEENYLRKSVTEIKYLCNSAIESMFVAFQHLWYCSQFVVLQYNVGREHMFLLVEEVDDDEETRVTTFDLSTHEKNLKIRMKVERKSCSFRRCAMSYPPTPPIEPPPNGEAEEAQVIVLPRLIPPAKRQRRPSVRLGDIGEHPTSGSEFHQLQHRVPKPRKTSKSRPLMHMTVVVPDSGAIENVGGGPGREGTSGGSRDEMRRFGGPISRFVRMNWFSPKVEEEDLEVKSSGGVIRDEDNYREYDEEMVREDSLSPRREQKSRISRTGIRSFAEGVELNAPLEISGRKWDGNGDGLAIVGEGCSGVRPWLNGLGLGRYFSVFEVHEIDEDVLPLLTLEDLKDMGINAVGSRRKMFCGIQKLRKSSN